MRLTVLALLVFSTYSLASDKPTFYEERQRGWFWHEVEPEPEEEPQTKEPLTPQPESVKPVTPRAEQVALDSSWLKANLEKLMQKAIDEPTDANLAAYAYANRLMMDMGSRFSTRMMEFMELEQALQESARRPFSTFALSEFSEERNKAVNSIMAKLKEKAHIWFFYSSTCAYCVKQVPVLEEFKARTGIPVLAISMDGGPVPGANTFEVVVDHDLRVSQMFGVRVTPTMHLVDNKKRQPIPLTEGLNTLPDIEKRVLLLSRQASFITDEEYQLARSVREIGVFRNETGEILADKSKLESDPGYLADLLKQRLDDVTQFGASKAVGTEQGGAANTPSTPAIQGTPVR